MANLEGRTQSNILLASLISSTMSTTITNPMEVAKLKHQYAPTICPRYPHAGAGELYKCGCASISLSDSFKGLSVMIPQVVINNLMFMQCYEFQRRKYSEYMSSTKATLLSSVIARIIVTTTLIPVEALRVRISNSTAQNVIQTSQKGLSITLTRDIIYSAMFWSTAEGIRNYLVGSEYRDVANKVDIRANLLAGGIGGGLISMITTPFDTLKTRIQSGVKAEGSILSQMRSIYQIQGIGGLFSGVHYRTAKSSFHSALYLIFYETLLERLSSGKNFFKP